jgi:hypothetical protein
MLRISWGTKIVLLYAGFVGMIMTMVIMTMREKVDLVTTNYYEKEILFQKQIDGSNNFAASGSKVEISQTGKDLRMQFPGEAFNQASGVTLQFYRPSDKSLDFRVPLNPDANGFQTIAHPSLTKGLYHVKAAWKKDSKDYFFEETFFYQ